MHSLVSIADLLKADQRKTQTYEKSSDDEDDSVTTGSVNTWASHGFIKPQRAVMELSGFPILTWLYKILVALAVISSSAERAMSRVRIIKNRLHSTKLDDWFSSLIILACEKNVIDKISVDEITDGFAG